MVKYRARCCLAIATFVIVLACLTATAIGGGIYICKGSDGGSHFTNTPTNSDCKVFRRKHSSSFSNTRYNSNLNRYSPKMSYSDRVPYHSYIDRVGFRYQVDPNLIKAVIRTESSFNRYAVSSQGAKGLMQLMPETAREMEVADPFNPGQNIEGGTRYLRTLMDTFKGNLTLTLAAYNAGPTLVKRVNRIPRIPETINYVKRVLGHYKGYSNGQPIRTSSRIRVNKVVTVH